MLQAKGTEIEETLFIFFAILRAGFQWSPSNLRESTNIFNIREIITDFAAAVKVSDSHVLILLYKCGIESILYTKLC